MIPTQDFSEWTVQRASRCGRHSSRKESNDWDVISPNYPYPEYLSKDIISHIQSPTCTMILAITFGGSISGKPIRLRQDLMESMSGCGRSYTLYCKWLGTTNRHPFAQSCPTCQKENHRSLQQGQPKFFINSILLLCLFIVNYLNILFMVIIIHP